MRQNHYRPIGESDMNRHRTGVPRQMLLAPILTCLICLIASQSFAAETPQKVITIEGITEYRLDNGLKLLLFPDPSTPTVTVNLTVLVGSRHEGYGETGMAHLLEHMLFKGTPTHREIPRLLKERGAEYNANTWIDRTAYFETMTGTDDNLDFALKLESDRLVNSLIRREDLLSEMTVVRNEFEMGENSPRAILSQRMTSAAYQWHNYGKSTIGNKSDIERVPIERLQAFYHKYYRPDNCVLIIAGKFNEDHALANVMDTFGKLKNPKQLLDSTYTEEPAQDGDHYVTLRRVGKVPYVGVLYHIPPGAHADFSVVEVLNRILVSEPSGRLYKALVTTRKASSVSGSATGCHDPGEIEFTAEVDHGSTPDAVRDGILEVTEGIGKDPITKEEVTRAQRELKNQRDLLMTRTSSVARLLGDAAAMGDWRLFFYNRDREAAVTASDVNRVASAYLVRNNRTVGVYQPTESAERVAVPGAPDTDEMLKDYHGRAELAAGESFAPTPENIEKRVERFTLPNGMKVALLAKKTRGQAVVGSLELHYGSEASLKGHTSATPFIAPLLQYGTRGRDRQQIKDELERLGARLRGSGGAGEASFGFQTTSPNLPGLLSLLAEVLKEPTFPDKELEVLKRKQLAALKASVAEPNARAGSELQRRLSPYSPDNVRYVPTIEESIDRLSAVSADEIRKIHQEQWGPDNAEIAIVGDFDPAAVKKQLEGRFGNWKAAVPYQRIERPARMDVAGSRDVILTPDKANAIYVAGMMLDIKDNDPDYPALEIANFILGGGSLSSRLANRVRQQEGLSYTVGSRFSADAKDAAARFVVFAICNPKNVEKVDRAISEELARLVDKGVGEAELSEAKKSFLEMLRVARAEDSSIASTLADELSNGRTFAYYADLEKKIEALTPAQVNDVIRKRLMPSRLVVIQAGDFKKQTSRLP
jgi:zinc protease